LSKVIKASEVKGKYEIKSRESNISLDFKKDAEKNDRKNNTSADNAKPKVIKADLEAEKRAKEIISQAEKEAEKIIIKAEKEKNRLEDEKDKIYREIKAEAEKDALKESEEKINQLCSSLAETAESFNQEIKREKNIFKKEVVKLAVKIASLIINSRIENEPEIINNIASDIVRNMDENHKNIKIKVHPMLIPYLEKNKFYNNMENAEVEFKSDKDLKPGDCIVSSNLGGKESVITDKLELIKNELLKEVEINAEY